MVRRLSRPEKKMSVPFAMHVRHDVHGARLFREHLVMPTLDALRAVMIKRLHEHICLGVVGQYFEPDLGDVVI